MIFYHQLMYGFDFLHVKLILKLYCFTGVGAQIWEDMPQVFSCFPRMRLDCVEIYRLKVVQRGIYFFSSLKNHIGKDRDRES